MLAQYLQALPRMCPLSVHCIVLKLCYSPTEASTFKQHSILRITQFSFLPRLSSFNNKIKHFRDNLNLMCACALAYEVQ